MKLERIKCKPLERAKNLCVSRSYIIGCTGAKAAILDKQLNLIHMVDGLQYVYAGQVSPDETKLLLISNCNKFYIINLQTFEKTCVTVKAPYNKNLEGQGCWSFDGKQIWIPVQRSSGYIISALRCYYADDLSKYEDHLPDKYYLSSISRLEKTCSYLLIGRNRQEENKEYFIHFDGGTFQAFPLEESAELFAPSVTIDEENAVVTVSSPAGCKQFTLEGKALQAISHPAPKDKTLRFSDVLLPLLNGEPEKQKEIQATCQRFGLENIPAPDHITKYAASAWGSYLFLASQSGFYLLDANTEDILAYVLEEYGVHNFAELAQGSIAIATWSGIKLYRLYKQ